MKFAPPGAEPYRILNRLDGFVGSDPLDMPFSVAQEIAAALPPGKRSEIERIRARMIRRQLQYEYREKKRRVLWRKFGLRTR